MSGGFLRISHALIIDARVLDVFAEVSGLERAFKGTQRLRRGEARRRTKGGHIFFEVCGIEQRVQIPLTAVIVELLALESPFLA
jgi:hypothetical protein